MLLGGLVALWPTHNTTCTCRYKKVPWYLFFLQKFIWYEIQLINELVIGSFEPPDARAACDRIRRHFANGSYLLKVWLVKTSAGAIFQKIPQVSNATCRRVKVLRVTRTLHLDGHEN